MGLDMYRSIDHGFHTTARDYSTYLVTHAITTPRNDIVRQYKGSTVPRLVQAQESARERCTLP
jgi:hypothetical protein